MPGVEALSTIESAVKLADYLELGSTEAPQTADARNGATAEAPQKAEGTPPRGAATRAH